MQQTPIKNATGPAYGRQVFKLIALLSAFRLLLAFVLELGNDEAYYWLYSLDLAWNYFDHPPLVALWIRLFTLNGLLDSEGFLRLGAVVSCAMATWFMYRAVALMAGERAGWFAAVLYNASFYAGLTAGLYIMPDSPQMVFWTLSLWAIARITINEKDTFAWLLFGGAAGLCIMSKVHGAFLWIGLGSYMLLFRRRLLSDFRPYMAALLTALLISPILFWNIEHDFITYRFHSQRVTVGKQEMKALSFLKELFSQLGFNNPLNVLMIVAGSLYWRRHKMGRYKALAVFNLVAWPMAGLLLFVSLFRNSTLPHWSGPAYVSLLPLAAIWLNKVRPASVMPGLLRGTLGVFMLVLCAWGIVVNFYPGTFGSREKSSYGYGDLTTDMYGWKEAGKVFGDFYRQEVKEGRTSPGTPLICGYWWGAHVEYYFARPLDIPVIGLGPVNHVHHYQWTNTFRAEKADMNKAYCIIPSDEVFTRRSKFEQYYSRMDQVNQIEIKRSGGTLHYFNVYKLSGWKGEVPKQ
ncbi:MAG TPA: glycosyltransferase family 39 protein [Flavisolibacter sp.]|nr:glycosyltransferase family 39 protein [Flavisolibacter sp.]